MRKNLVVVDGKYYFIDDETGDVLEVHVDKPVLSMDTIKKILLEVVKSKE